MPDDWLLDLRSQLGCQCGGLGQAAMRRAGRAVWRCWSGHGVASLRKRDRLGQAVAGSPAARYAAGRAGSVPAQEHGDKHDDQDENDCSDADVHGLLPWYLLGGSGCLIRLSRAGEGWVAGPRGRVADAPRKTRRLSYLVKASTVQHVPEPRFCLVSALPTRLSTRYE